MEFQQEKIQLMHTPGKPGLLVENSMGDIRDLSQETYFLKDKLLTNPE